MLPPPRRPIDPLVSLGALGHLRSPRVLLCSLGSIRARTYRSSCSFLPWPRNRLRGREGRRMAESYSLLPLPPSPSPSYAGFVTYERGRAHAAMPHETSADVRSSRRRRRRRKRQLHPTWNPKDSPGRSFFSPASGAHRYRKEIETKRRYGRRQIAGRGSSREANETASRSSMYSCFIYMSSGTRFFVCSFISRRMNGVFDTPLIFIGNALSREFFFFFFFYERESNLCDANRIPDYSCNNYRLRCRVFLCVVE